MDNQKRYLLNVLKTELLFLEKGGYSGSVRQPWRYQLFLEDSPVCANSNTGGHAQPCSECILMQAVPPGSREEKIPCRHIRLNERGETLDSLYRYADQRETEETYVSWLRHTIATLEAQDPRSSSVAATITPHRNLTPEDDENENFSS